MAMAFGLRLSLIAFSVMTFDGLLRRREFAGALQEALIVGGMFWGLGWFMGEVARRIIEENLDADRAKAKTETISKAASTTDKS